MAQSNTIRLPITWKTFWLGLLVVGLLAALGVALMLPSDVLTVRVHNAGATPVIVTAICTGVPATKSVRLKPGEEQLLTLFEGESHSTVGTWTVTLVTMKEDGTVIDTVAKPYKDLTARIDVGTKLAP